MRDSADLQRWDEAGMMTPAQLQILQHTLGADQYGRRKRYCDRNFFCAGPKDEPDCRALVEMGFMQYHKTTELFPYFNCSVTDAGWSAMMKASPAPPKLTRSQLRFAEYRQFADAFDCSFREFLRVSKTDWYRDLKEGRLA